MGLGPWAKAHGPRPMGQGPWAKAHGPGPWARAHGPWAGAHGPRPKAQLLTILRIIFQKMDLFFEEIPHFMKTKKNRNVITSR